MATTIYLGALRLPKSTLLHPLKHIPRQRAAWGSVLPSCGQSWILTRGQATAAATATVPPEDAEENKLDPGAPSRPFEPQGPVLSGKPFESLRDKVTDKTLKAITEKPFKLKIMSPIQAEVLPLLPELAKPFNPDLTEEEQAALLPRDLLARAKTGTGKTLAFLVPAIEARYHALEAHGTKSVRDAGLVNDRALEKKAMYNYARSRVGTLIISPTRELATQIANEALKLSFFHRDMEVRLITGGTNKRIQIREWMKNRRDIVIATPGRLRDLLETEPDFANGLKHTQMLILDEADTLLDMGFRGDIDAITQHLPPSPQRQTFLFSATVSRAIQQIARATLSKNHLFIDTVKDDHSPVHAHIPQYYTAVPSAADQFPHILRLIVHDQLSNLGQSKIMVFLPTTRMTMMFADMLRDLRHTFLPGGKDTRIYEIHSKRRQESRSNTSDSFREDKSGCSILVTSDVSARGVDYPNVTRVIQVGIPQSSEQYVHRIGRTGRGGLPGRGDLVLLPWEIGFVTWQLTEMELKQCTTGEMRREVEDLAKKFDENPPEQPRRFKRNGPVVFEGPVLPSLKKVDEEVSSVLSAMDRSTIEETFASLLGFYMPKSPELRIQKSVIIQGCKDWTTEACGLKEAPYTSEAFLKKLGMDDGRTKGFGRPRVERAPRRDLDTPRWAHRGSTRKRNESMTRDRLGDKMKLDPNDPPYDPEQFRSARYGQNPERVYSRRYDRNRDDDRSFNDRERWSSDRSSSRDRGNRDRDRGYRRREDSGRDRDESRYRRAQNDE